MSDIKKYNEFINESFNSSTPNGNELGSLFLKLLAIRDQSHIFHWQTNSFAQHSAFGEFYDTFLDEVDAMVEMIMGLKGRPSFGTASIELSDYSEVAIQEFLNRTYTVLKSDLKEVLSEEVHEEIFDQARLIIACVDKLQYLLTLS